MKEIFWSVEYIATFVEMFMGCYFCGTFIIKDEIRSARNKSFFLSFISATIIIVLNKIEFFSYATMVVCIVLFIVIQWIIYKKKYILSCGLIFAYTVLVSAIDAMVMYFVAFVGDTNIGYILEGQSFTRLACIVLSKSILIISIVTLNRVIAHKKIMPPMYIAVMGLSSAFLLLSNIVLVHSELNKSNDEISIFTMTFFIASLGIEMILFSLVIKISEGYEQKQNTLLIELNNKMLQKSLDETEHTFELWRQSIHDYKNNIIALSQLAEEERFEEVRRYLKKENELIEQKVFYTKTGNSVIDTIVNTKQSIAEKKNILFIVNVDIPADIVISDMDMANILGNLIDNAIEASDKEEKPYIDITIKQEKSFLIINIKNKCTNIIELDDIKTKKLNPEFHGIGLKSVRSIVKKYDGQILLNIKNKEFIANIIIQNK